MHLRYISLEPRRERIAHRPLLRAGRQKVDNQVKLSLVIEQQMSPRHPDRVARHLRCDKGIAVAIAANPGAEAEHLGQCVRLNLDPVGNLQRL